MPTIGDLASRRTIEALRAGVPNRDAVRQLRCNQPEIEERFRALLAQSQAAVAAGTQARGLVVSGDFGAGKSHLLEYLELLADRENFVSSKIVVSKETSLADPVKVFRAAAASARIPGKVGAGLSNVMIGLNFRSPAYTSFFAWAGSESAHLPQQIPASLYVYEYGRDQEFREAIMRSWAGDLLPATQLKSKLRELGQLSSYNIGRPPAKGRLALHRLRFAVRLAMAAGYGGWVLLIDEAELIGQYSIKQRARAYQELARWTGAIPDGGDETVFPGLATVAAITSDFEASVLRSGKCDAEVIPNRFRATGKDDDGTLATLAERGMRLIQQDRLPLGALTAAHVRETHDELRSIYSEAFQWDAPAVLDSAFTPLGSAVMRPLVRRWITEWDLRRLYPGAPVDIVATPLPDHGYAEDPDLDSETVDGVASEGGGA
ncbi:MAG: DUF2791 family P-loop domain-containing protein [Chloroflexi bacterium]|nr:DUF2791 family P-loop domain-containing protein [Chloroflexota bacterium]